MVTSRSTILLAVALAAGACQSKEESKRPLGAAGAINVDTSAAARAVNPHKLLAPEAKAALVEGNQLMMARKYPEALAKYRAAAKLAPANAAPYYGIWMAAVKLNDKALADSAMAAVNARAENGQMLFSDSLMKKTHTNDQAPPANPKS